MARRLGVCQRQSRDASLGHRRLSRVPAHKNNKLTSQKQSPTVRNIPSRVAEGLALRCHGNRFREMRNDQVPIPGSKSFRTKMERA